MPNYWLMKTEPNTYSIEDLAAEKNQTTQWEGVRNYAARNIMRDDMKKGDLVLVYHSNAKPPGVVGTAKVVRESYVDHFAFDNNSKYFDPRSSRENPRWFMVDIKLVKQFRTVVGLPLIRETKSLADMVLVNNSRLSVQPVRKKEFDTILKLADQLAKAT